MFTLYLHMVSGFSYLFFFFLGGPPGGEGGGGCVKREREREKQDMRSISS